jgi:predicted ATPase
MAIIEGIRIRNFKALKDITMGKLWNIQNAKPLTPMTVVIGKNGVGKSTLFDTFGFLSDCLKYGVEEACDTNGRRGFDNIRTHGQSGPIEFVVYYRQNNPRGQPPWLIAYDTRNKSRHFAEVAAKALLNKDCVVYLLNNQGGYPLGYLGIS